MLVFFIQQSTFLNHAGDPSTTYRTQSYQSSSMTKNSLCKRISKYKNTKIDEQKHTTDIK